MDAPYFPFYPADWLSDSNVSTLSLEEAGAYITLLAYMWREGKDCTLPDDDKYLARLLHISPRKWAQIRKVLVEGHGSVFKVSVDGRLWNKRLSEEWQLAAEKIEKNANAARERWRKTNAQPKASKRNAHAMQMHTERIATDDASQMHMRIHAISDSDTDPDTDQKNDGDNNVARLFRAYQQIFVTGMNKVQEKDLLEFMDKGMEVDLMILDFKKAMRNNAGFSYAFRVITNQFQAGIKTVEQYEANEAQRQAAASKPRAGPGKKSDEKDQRYEKFYELFPDT